MRGFPPVWSRWVAFVGRPMDPRPLLWVKRLVAGVLVVDLLAIVVFGAAGGVLFDAAHGGLIGKAEPFSIGAGPAVGPVWWALSLLALGSVAIGIGGRWPLLLGVFAYAQLGHFDWPGDRAIDRICRTVLLILVFSDVAHARPAARRVAAWPADLIRVLLVAIYLDAGIGKLASRPPWTDIELNPLYTIMASPQVGRLDPVTFHGIQPAFAALGVATLVLELTSPLLLWRPTARWWAVFGAALHVGLAFTMNLGIFPFAMLALYPVLLVPWIAPQPNGSTR